MERNSLAALYTHYHVDTQIYPPPDLQINEIIQELLLYPSNFYLQSSRFPNKSLADRQRENFRQRFQIWEKDKKRRRSNRNETKTNHKRLETNQFYQRNMITVRRIPCHEVLNSQTIMKNSSEYEQINLTNKWNKKIQSANLVENQLQGCKNYPHEFDTSLSHVKLQAPPIQSSINKLLVSSSTTTSNKDTSTILVSNIFFSQQALEKKMSNSMSVRKARDIYVDDSSACSLAFTQLLIDDHNQPKPDAAIPHTTTTMPGTQMDFEALPVMTPHVSSSRSVASIVPHFPSTIVPHVRRHVRSSTSTRSNVCQTEFPTLTNENIQDLVDQLNSCIDTLSLLIEQEKYIIAQRKSYENEKISRTKKKSGQLSSSSISIKKTCSTFSKQSIIDENDFISEDITVRRCNSFNNQEHTSMCY
ncbi:unnamed protein product [Rotaria socialis]|uniref:Uncharacterized protein n=1 Tax=Rotaria socialis TaxID=392032 RepID=A0A820TW64_9BILA|nr:unnamed protein product [Rotaria socialis]CAF3390586.1 unnamed protein product [Rotaria socialis]CAF3456984.1 unnamed protein product [Rotaria socialis]CAF4474505.1 unnamed protein product [Rotaria socialis]CAF4617468.1 unnamed protein product [Rotaria socialis]